MRPNYLLACALALSSGGLVHAQTVDQRTLDSGAAQFGTEQRPSRLRDSGVITRAAPALPPVVQPFARPVLKHLQINHPQLNHRNRHQLKRHHLRLSVIALGSRHPRHRQPCSVICSITRANGGS